MAHINSIGAGMFSDLSVCNDPTTNAAAIAAPTETTLTACFAASKYKRIEGVREFPAIGTPANIVNVPVYGQSTSQQIQGQADAPSMELTINYIPNDWSSISALGQMVGDGTQRVFRFALLNSEPSGYNSTPAGATALGGAAGEETQNSIYYWVGKIEALLVNPQLTDANTATLTISVQSKFFGAYTVAVGS